MKRPIFLLAVLGCLCSVRGQMVVQDGTSFSVDGGTSLRVDAPLLWTIETGSEVVNNGDIVLSPQTDLNEAPDAAITGAGTERTTRDLQAPLTAVDPGGLGGIITTDATLGTTLVVRGHLPFTDYSGHTSIARWIDFSPSNNSSLNAGLAMRYEPAELNGLMEAEQRVHIRAYQDIWWHLPSVVDLGAHTVTTSGLDSLGLFTTFDEDLPNGISTGYPTDPFALLGAPGQQLYLRVPSGERVRTLEISSMNGSLISRRNINWSEGLHALPEQDLSAGLYHLVVNDTITFSFLQP